MFLPSWRAISSLVRPTSLYPLQAKASASARYSTGTHNSSVISQLRRVAELAKRVGATNSNIEKQGIIAEYPDLRALLEQVYHPKFRSHLSSTSLNKYLSSPSAAKTPSSPPSDIISLFDKLSTRSVTGNAAKDLTRAFLVENGILAEGETGHNGDKKELLEVFKRLIDRNLVAGFGARTLSGVRWGAMSDDTGDIGVSTRGDGGHKSQPPAASKMASAKSVSTPKRKSMKAFSCALGKTILPSHLHTLFTPSSPKWFASRKLDGVRVITYLDFHLSPNSPSQGIVKPIISAIQHLSRSGNIFTSLGNLGSPLAVIADYPGLAELLKDDSASLPSTEGDSEGSGAIRRLVLDGEVCVMRTPHPLWSEDSNLVEEFTATVSEIRRQNHTIAHPGYYLFDLLSWSDFNGGVPGSERKIFSKRISDLKDLGTWLGSELEKQGLPSGIKVLEQVEVGGVKEVEGMVETAADRGWEGLVLRAEKPYKGSRSSDVRKFKQWQDAEYAVRDVELSRQRLSINGVFAEYEAVAALVFDHKGHPVSVSSGMTAAQRVKWAKDPSLIIGKQMTVEYFSESEAVGREGVRSLRFPRIKTIWDGTRDI